MSESILLDVDIGSPVKSRAGMSRSRQPVLAPQRPDTEGPRLLLSAMSPQLAAIALGVLDLLDGANLLIDRSGAVVWCNSEAERLILDGGVVRVSPEQMLTFCGHLENAAFRSLADECFFDRASGKAQPQLLNLPSRDDTGGHGLVAVLPVSGSGGTGQAPIALLVSIRGSATGLAAPAAELRRIYGLTRTEASVVADLAQGATVEQVAARRGRSIATIRNQQHSAYGKLGVNTQVNLAALLARHWPRLAP
jgi:DNA-binding CsgD family transcriptional regulator